MAKQLDIKMEKVYDFPDGIAEKYDILAYFKEQESIKNKVQNQMIEKAQGTPHKCAPAQVSVNCPHPTTKVTTREIDMSVTNLLLFYIAFFLFVSLIIHD